MRYFTPRAFSTRNPRTGKVASALAGSVITETTYRNLSDNIIQRCGIIPLRNRPRNGEFTEAEFQFLVDGYLNNLSYDNITALFYQQFPKHVINDGPLCQLFIIRGLDNTNSYVGFQHPAKKLLKVCLETAPGRFV